jgi:hypothetical protein
MLKNLNFCLELQLCRTIVNAANFGWRRTPQILRLLLAGAQVQTFGLPRGVASVLWESLASLGENSDGR